MLVKFSTLWQKLFPQQQKLTQTCKMHRRVFEQHRNYSQVHLTLKKDPTLGLARPMSWCVRSWWKDMQKSTVGWDTLFLWCFCEIFHTRCTWPKLDKFLYDNIWQSTARTRSK